MKVLLTTIVDNVNYGTYLQGYATVKILQDRGCEVDVLNYTRPHLNRKNMLAKAKSNGLKSYLRGMVTVGLDAYMKYNLKKFLFRKAHTTIGFTDWTKFRETLPKYDLYLVGSDQVWNSTHNHGIDGVFFYEGVNGRKASYASSVGIESFPQEQYAQIKQLLGEFSQISVRESFGVEALKSLGFENVSQVLDPTLMLTGDEWRKVCGKRFKKTEPFLLVYSVEVNRDKETIEIARKIAKERGLKVYLISPYVKFNSKLNVDKLFSMADTDTFLALFSEADYAVVSSFHGTAFAINFGCQFVTVSPERFSTRVQSILKLLKLEDRYVKTIDDVPHSDIDYSEVNKILDANRLEASKVIDNIINY